MFPRTTHGRTFCIFYALFGLPITAIVLVKIGGGFAKVIKKTDKYSEILITKFGARFLKKKGKWKIYVRTFQLITSTVLFCLLFWITPALIATKMEGWDVVTAIYFYFITMTTIGLGDIVPGMASGGKMTQTIMVKQVIISYIYIYFMLLSYIYIYFFKKGMMEAVSNR